MRLVNFATLGISKIKYGIGVFEPIPSWTHIWQCLEWIVQRLPSIDVVVMCSNTELTRVLRCVCRIGCNLIGDACYRQGNRIVQQSVDSAADCVHFDVIFCSVPKHLKASLMH